MARQSVIHHRAASALAPSGWAPLFSDTLPKDRRIAVLEAVAEAGETELFLPRRLDSARLHAGGRFLCGGQSLDVGEILPLPGGARLKVPTTAPFTIEYAGETVEIVPQPRPSSLSGRRVLFAIPDLASPEQLGDWARYHVDAHKADAVCLMRRASPNGMVAESDVIGSLFSAGVETVAFYDIGIATGHPGSPARSSQFFAPDGPGKALRSYDVDPWHAPLDEIGYMEAVRRALLHDARSVLFMSIADLVVPSPTGGTIFEMAEASESYLRFRGRFAYPWRRADPGVPASHHEHGAISFDGSNAGSIWCVAPQGPMRNAFWRPYRISMAAPDPRSEELSFWRCAAVLHPGEPAASLAPKSSLIADEELLGFMEAHFGNAPESPPAPEVAPVPPYDPETARVLIVTTMKNEGPFILEWLAWHRAMGVTDFLVYTNDCTDGTDTMFDLLHRKGFLEHRENPYRITGEKPQHAAYHDAETSELAAAADWVICMDVDEYINVHVGEGRLSDLFRAVPDATMFGLTWRLFGNAEVFEYEDRFITEQFMRCAPEYTRKPHQAWGIKTLFRPLGHYKKFGVHRPKGLKPECLPQIKWVNGSGEVMPDEMLRTGWRSTTSTYGYGLVTLKHYALRSAESYLVKRDRGRVNHVDRDQGLNYWFRMNNNAEIDRRSLSFVPKARVEFDRLMADREIAEQHARCVAAHRAKIAELKGRSDYAALYDEVTGERLIKLSRMHRSFGSAVFMGGPDLIPPGVEDAVDLSAEKT